MHTDSTPPLSGEHKNRQRAPLHPLDAPTLGLSVFGLGFLRPAPGTWGSLPPVALAMVLHFLAPALVVLIALLVVLVLSCVVCVVWGRYGEARFGRKDAAEVVIDETAGQCFPLLVLGAFAMLPASSPVVHESWVLGMLGSPVGFVVLAALSFVLFRGFDILKPWPARGLESLPHGWGVLLDDVMAGIYAAIVLSIVVVIPG